MGLTTLITGGCRSGKSRQALVLAKGISGYKVFVATAEARDEEMKERIARHRKERGGEWETVEEPVDLVHTFQRLENQKGVVVLDCLTLWISNLMLRGDSSENILNEAGRLEEQLKRMPCETVIITNEVGSGIVPENSLAREFRDLAGEINQRFAASCDRVIHMVAGIAMNLKSGK